MNKPLTPTEADADTSSGKTEAAGMAQFGDDDWPSVMREAEVSSVRQPMEYSAPASEPVRYNDVVPVQTAVQRPTASGVTNVNVPIMPLRVR